MEAGMDVQAGISRLAMRAVVLTGVVALVAVAAQGQSPQRLIQVVVDTERAANQNDHTNWVYLDEDREAKTHVVEWVAATQEGDLKRVLVKDEHKVAEAQQREGVDHFLHDEHARKKQMEENKHDGQQVDDLLKLLPAAFVWTQTGATDNSAILHFEPEPGFHPPTREARVFSAMAGDVEVDLQAHRIRSMRGHLMHDVAFGGGLLGRLKEGSSFALEQAPVGGGVWELTGLHVHLQGNALLFKSISLEQDEMRSRYAAEPPTLKLEQAVGVVMSQPEELPGG
jgi:hypothetical protein